MAQNMVDSLLALSNNGNTIELYESENGQGNLPRKKEEVRELQQRVKILKRLLMVSSQARKQFDKIFGSLDDNTSVKINYVKQATDILDTLDAHDRYENLERDLKELEGLLYNSWEDEYGDEMMEAYDELIFTINTTTSSDRASTPKNIINTQETDIFFYFVHADITRNGKETKIHDNIKSNKNIKSNDKTLDNVPEAISCIFPKCKFETAKKS